MRITNADTLLSHGNVAGRRAVLEILEAGLHASDPYYNTLDLLRLRVIPSSSATVPSSRRMVLMPART